MHTQLVSAACYRFQFDTAGCKAVFVVMHGRWNRDLHMFLQAIARE